MNPGQALSRVTEKFRQNKLEEAEIEAAVLLCYLLNLDKAGLYANTDNKLTTKQLAELDNLVMRRLGGEPAAYIIKQKEFFGVELYVDHRVLIPRPETETLVEAAIRVAADESRILKKELSIADVGTGSAAIAIALARHISNAKIYATDISRSALEVAAVNVERYGLQERITLLEGELLEPLDRKLDMIVANLPYIAGGDIEGLASEIALHEPRIALDGGENGIVLYRDFIEQSKIKLVAGGALLMEIGKGQEREIAQMANQVFPKAAISFTEDLHGIIRVICIIAA